MKKGFTLVEVLAVIIVLGILAGIIFPVIESGISNNSKKALSIEKNNVIKATKDWSLKNIDKLPENDGITKVKLSELKQGFIPLNIKNPQTGRLLSNETYVLIKEISGDYEYEVYFYDIPDNVSPNDIINFDGNFLTEEVSLNSTIPEYDISVVDEFGNELSYSKQYILNDNEVSHIDTSSKNIYSIVYTVLYNDKIYKAVKTIIIK